MPDSAADLVPPRPTLPKLRDAAADCRACPLWEQATQTVFGAGRRSSPAMFVGEQPGDRVDLEGAPFVGPAGRILDEAPSSRESIAGRPTSRTPSSTSSG